jgi:hypothetical protein
MAQKVGDSSSATQCSVSVWDISLKVTIRMLLLYQKAELVGQLWVRPPSLHFIYSQFVVVDERGNSRLGLYVELGEGTKGRSRSVTA